MLKGSLGLSLAALLALSAGAAGAQTRSRVAQPGYTKADVASFNGGPDTLPRMINRIERTTGGRVVEIQFTTADGMPGYRAVVARGGHVTFMHVAAGQGAAVELTSNRVPDWMMHWRARADVKNAARAKVSLPDAIRTAEQQENGAPAVAAGIATSASNPLSEVKAYNVLIDQDGDVRRVAVDDTTNQVIADPQALAGWP